MIQALAAQAGQVEPGFAPQIARWAIHLSAQGDLLGVLPLGDLTDKRNKGREFLICPQFTFSQMKAGGTPKAHPFRESAGTIALIEWGTCRPGVKASNALNAGAHCAKISGAGGGGFMMFLTDPIYIDKVSAALSASHEGGLAYRCHFTGAGVKAWRVP